MIITPIVVGLIGHWVSQAVKDREVQGKFVELAVEILRANPTEDTKNLREWAIQIIDIYSGVPFTPKGKEELVKLVPITGMVSPDCSEYIQRAKELLDGGEHEGGLAYLKKAGEICAR